MERFSQSGSVLKMRVAANYGFDITPARLITGLITEKGICRATEKDIKEMFSDKFN